MPASITRRGKAASHLRRSPAASRSKLVAYELIGLGLILLGLMLVFATFLHGPIPQCFIDRSTLRFWHLWCLAGGSGINCAGG